MRFLVTNNKGLMEHNSKDPEPSVSSGQSVGAQQLLVPWVGFQLVFAGLHHVLVFVEELVVGDAGRHFSAFQMYLPFLSM